MQYLTMRECRRRLRLAGMESAARELRDWIRQQRLRDVWVVGRHTYIYEGEIVELIARGPD